MGLLSEDKRTKAAALARIRVGIPVEDVANELGLPLALIEEWEASTPTESYAVAQAATMAPEALVEKLTKSILAGDSEVDLQVVKTNMEKAANKVVSEVINNSLISIDLERAKTLNLLATSIGGLYNAFFNKSQTVNILNNNNQPGTPAGAMGAFINRD